MRRASRAAVIGCSATFKFGAYVWSIKLEVLARGKRERTRVPHERDRGERRAGQGHGRDARRCCHVRVVYLIRTFRLNFIMALPCRCPATRHAGPRCDTPLTLPHKPFVVAFKSLGGMRQIRTGSSTPA
jgi:hypothetical protein